MRYYVDARGAESTHDGSSSRIWRIGSYAVAVRDGAILLVVPVWDHRWELPGGGVEVEREESISDAASRECREETGFIFTPDNPEPRFIDESFFRLHEPDRFWHSLMFVVVGSVSDRPDPAWRRDPAEIAEVEWVPLASLTNDLVPPRVWKALRQLGLV